MRDRSDHAESRFAVLFEVFKSVGITAEPAVWNDEFADEVTAQLRRVQAVLVWCNPIEGGGAATGWMDSLLRDVAAASTWRASLSGVKTRDCLGVTRLAESQPPVPDCARI